MTPIEIAKGMILQRLGANIESFEQRLIAQKKVYLLEELGVPLGYMYDWYVYGPYSPGLTDFLCSNSAWFSVADFSAQKLRPRVEEIIVAVNDCVKSRPDHLGIASWYELLASLRYIETQWGHEGAALNQKLREYKPQFSDDDCEQGKNTLDAVFNGRQSETA